MEISIIIPYKKYIGYLRECLESVQKQTFTDYEVIIAFHEQGEQDVKLIQSEFEFKHFSTINCGDCNVSIARNQGLKAAKGNYICFLDADDYLLPETLTIWMQRITEMTMVTDVLYGAIENTWLKYQSFIDEFYERQTKFHTNNALDIVIKETTDNRNLKFDNKTILGKLFRREFLLSHQLEFDTELEYYSELPFILQSVEFNARVAGTKGTFYVKRSHNDPINMPSLTQSLKWQEPIAKIKAYLKATRSLNENSTVKKSLDGFMIAYCWNHVINQIVNEDDSEKRQEILKALSECALEINPIIIRKQPLKKRILLKKLRKQKFSSCLTYIRFINQSVEIKQSVKSGSNMRKYLYKNVFLKLKVKEGLIVYESFLGKNYSDSPKYIYQHLLEQDNNYKHVWIINDLNTEIPGNAKKVVRFSLKYFYYMARANYIVNNMRQPRWIKKREETTFLETWHGTPLKKLVFDMEDVHSANPLYKEEFYYQSREWDYLVAANEFSADVFASGFLYEREKMLIDGYPRNDILYARNQEELALEIKEELNLPLDKKIILYAPTWRDDDFYAQGKYKFSLKLDLERCQREFGDDYIILLRTHYFIADALDLSPYKGFAYNVSKYDDIAELYLISDMLITDYSSVFFDYANLQRPILFYMYDLEKYRDVLRGFYIDIEKEIPGPIIKTNDQMVDAIRNIDQVEKDYQSQYQAFYDRFCNIDDGYASERIVEKVFK